MPIFKVGQDMHYFAHVPKCGGSSVELYLQQRFGKMAFVDQSPMDREAKRRRWTRSSPQHLPWQQFERLMPPEWFKSAFGVVRHPEARLISVYHHFHDGRAGSGDVPTIDEWFARWLERDDFYQFDNHLMPQAQIVPDWATVFRLEEGLDAIVPHIDGLAGNVQGPRELPRVNKRKADGPSLPKAVLSEETKAKVAEFYAEDFARFGYRPDGSLGPMKRAAAVPKARRNNLFWRVARAVRYEIKSRRN